MSKLIHAFATVQGLAPLTTPLPSVVQGSSVLEKQACLCSDCICDMYMPVFLGSFGHTVKKYNSFGDLVQVLGTPGTKGTGLNPLQFDNPAELCVEDTGEMYIVDGDGGLNNRLIKLSQGT